MPAAPVHHTAVVDEAWDGPAAVAAMPNDAATLKYCHAWYSAGAGDEKDDYKFPHAKTKGGPANLAACRNGLARLSGADIPEADRAGVKAHLQAHIDDGEKESKSRMSPGREYRTATPLDVLREHRSAMALRGTRSRHTQVRPRAEIEFRAKPDGTGGTSYSFHGYAAAFEAPFEMWDAWGDPYFETLALGSCNRTLANSCDTQFLIGHNEASIPLARTRSGTMTLASDSHGLEVIVPSLDGRSPIVQSLASAMERGDMDEMSIGFIATQQQWSPDWMERRITEINLHRGDVSMVCWAANPAANGASIAFPVSEAAARAAGGREARMPTAPYSAKPGEGNECPQCHSMNDADAAYCDQCGTAVRPTGQSAAQEDETQRCGCGNWNASDAKFCDQCGTNLASDLDADNGGAGNGATAAPDTFWWSRERRADAEPDMSAKPPHDASAHGPGSLVCPNGQCARGNAPDAAYCDQCGTVLYDEGGLIKSGGSLDDVITDASGIIEESDMTLARLRVRVLALRR